MGIKPHEFEQLQLHELYDCMDGYEKRKRWWDIRDARMARWIRKIWIKKDESLRDLLGYDPLNPDSKPRATDDIRKELDDRINNPNNPLHNKNW